MALLGLSTCTMAMDNDSIEGSSSQRPGVAPTDVVPADEIPSGKTKGIELKTTQLLGASDKPELIQSFSDEDLSIAGSSSQRQGVVPPDMVPADEIPSGKTKEIERKALDLYGALNKPALLNSFSDEDCRYLKTYFEGGCESFSLKTSGIPFTIPTAIVYSLIFWLEHICFRDSYLNAIPNFLLSALSHGMFIAQPLQLLKLSNNKNPWGFRAYIMSAISSQIINILSEDKDSSLENLFIWNIIFKGPLMTYCIFKNSEFLQLNALNERLLNHAL